MSLKMSWYNIFFSREILLNPNEAGLFEGSFSWGVGGGGPFDPSPPALHIYAIIKQSI